MDRAAVLEDLKQWLRDSMEFGDGLETDEVLLKIRELEEIYE